MTVRRPSRPTLLALGRHDFAALLARPDPSAFELKRRLASQFTVRLRNQLAQLALTLGDEPSGAAGDDSASRSPSSRPAGRPTAGT